MVIKMLKTIEMVEDPYPTAMIAAAWTWAREGHPGPCYHRRVTMEQCP
jgi:hypothetical protein